MAAAAGLLALVLGAAVAVTHLGDEYSASFVNGVWLGLAERLREGVFYPPVFDGESVAGTRYYPVALLFNQLFYLTAPRSFFGFKLASLLLVFGIGLLGFALLRRIGVPRRLSLALAAVSVVGTHISTAALFTPHRGDALPVCLQLLALWAVFRPREDVLGRSSTSPGRLLLGGAACALALAAKPTAGWALVGLVWYLWDFRRQDLKPFLGSFAGVLVLALVGVHFGSGGRIWESIGRFTVHNMTFGTLVKAPMKILVMLESSASPLLVLVPLVLVGLVLGVARRALHLFELVLVGAAGIATVVMSDHVVASNHLLDVVCLVPLAAGVAWTRLERDGGGRGVVAAAVLFALALGVFHLREPLKEAARGVHPTPAQIVATERLAPDARILAEDPTIEVLRGQRPALLEACIYPALAELIPEAGRHLHAQVEAEAFDKVVLVADPEEGLATGWYVDLELGRPLTETIIEHYAVEAVEGPYYILGPKGRVATATTAAPPPTPGE